MLLQVEGHEGHCAVAAISDGIVDRLQIQGPLKKLALTNISRYFIVP
jgi:hypothetical protein